MKNVRWHLFFLKFILICSLTSGCAGVSHQSINSEAEDKKAKGLRYFDSSPYVLVQTDNQGGLTTEFMYLPDPAKKRQATPYSFLASNTTTLEFQKGILTSSSSDTDGTVVPVAVIKGLEQIAASAAKGLAFADQAVDTQGSLVPKVYLFKVVKAVDPADQQKKWGVIGAEGGDVTYQ